jgi:hypothetical protein
LKDSPYYTAALILHPEHRTTWMKKSDRTWESKDMEQAFYQVRALWQRFSLRLDQEIRLTDQAYDLRPESSSSNKSVNPLDQLRQKRQKKKTNQRSLDHFEIYCEESASYDIQMSPIEWWASQTKRFPRLALFAFECLSIMGMSDKPERVFSLARRTISWDRSRLGPELIEALECIKDWKKRTIIDYTDKF